MKGADLNIVGTVPSTSSYYSDKTFTVESLLGILMSVQLHHIQPTAVLGMMVAGGAAYDTTNLKYNRLV